MADPNKDGTEADRQSAETDRDRPQRAHRPQRRLMTRKPILFRRAKKPEQPEE